MHVPETPSPLERSISVMSLFPSPKFLGSVSKQRLSSVIDPLVKAAREDRPASR